MRLIDAEEVYCEDCEYKDKCEEINDENALFCDVYYMPTINPADLIPKGRWKREAESGYYWYVCSECGHDIPKTKYKHDWFANFCPNCGARMVSDDG